MGVLLTVVVHVRCVNAQTAHQENNINFNTDIFVELRIYVHFKIVERNTHMKRYNLLGHDICTQSFWLY